MSKDNTSYTKKEYIDLIENSPEFKESIKDKKDTEQTNRYNKVADKVSGLSKIIIALLAIILMIMIAQGSIFDDIPTLIGIVLSFIITSIFLEGFAEIIQLLQDIKEK